MLKEPWSIWKDCYGHVRKISCPSTGRILGKERKHTSAITLMKTTPNCWINVENRCFPILSYWIGGMTEQLCSYVYERLFRNSWLMPRYPLRTRKPHSLAGGLSGGSTSHLRINPILTNWCGWLPAIDIPILILEKVAIHVIITSRRRKRLGNWAKSEGMEKMSITGVLAVEESGASQPKHVPRDPYRRLL